MTASERLHTLRAHFTSGGTRPYGSRREALRSLRKAIMAHEEELLAAMHTDMRKPRFEAYMTDIGLVLGVIDHALKYLKEWMEPQRVPTPITLQPARSTVYYEPLGVVLIIAPWNYPVLLLLDPLVGALAAGNCAVLKPSEEVPATSAVLERIVGEALPADLVFFVQGKGSEVVPALMNDFRLDHVFFTGSTTVGKKILALAAPHLTPVTLELGGKTPAIVDRHSDVDVAAKRVAWSKYFNAGQTCIATDHALVHASVMDEFLDAFQRFVKHAFGEDPRESPHFARMVNDRRYDVVKNYLSQGRIFMGGAVDPGDRYIAPTVLLDVPQGSPVLQEEIFGPVLPVIPWTEREEVITITHRNPQPLATYIFSSDGGAQQYFRENIAFGGGCINHCMVHFSPHDIPFGGVGNSGMGRYHGRGTFDLFSTRKGIVHASTLLDHGLQEPPYTAFKERLLRRFL